MKAIFGFNLVELLFVVIIIGILSAISLPIYSSYVINTKRLEAAVTLSKLSVALENYFIIHNTYKNATLDSLKFPAKTAGNHYQLVIASATSSDYALQAIPLDDQAEKDSACGTLGLNSVGDKRITGTGDVTNCW